MLPQMTQQEEPTECKAQTPRPLEHDFLTSLNIVFLCTEILENYDHLCTENKKREYLQLIREAAQQMNQVFHRVLQSHSPLE